MTSTCRLPSTQAQKRELDDVKVETVPLWRVALAEAEAKKKAAALDNDYSLARSNKETGDYSLARPAVTPAWRVGVETTSHQQGRRKIRPGL